MQSIKFLTPAWRIQPMVKDLVCGMDVDEKRARYRPERAGRTYYFCSLRCKDSFDADPKRYIR
jgi:Cu+-exporting ATPase